MGEGLALREGAAQWYAAWASSPTVAFNSRVYPYMAMVSLVLTRAISLDLAQQAWADPALKVVINRLHGLA